jgi:hypothetical protein
LAILAPRSANRAQDPAQQGPIGAAPAATELRQAEPDKGGHRE